MLLSLLSAAVSVADAQTTQPAGVPTPQYNWRQQRQENSNGYNNDQRGYRRQRRNYANPQRGMFISTTQPDAIPMPPAMTGDWLIFVARNVFYRGRFTPADLGQPRPGPTPEDTLVFCGVFQSPGQMVGFIVDSNSNDVQTVKVGDTIAQGKITSLTLDTMEYQPASGGRLRLNVGQNLRGEQIWGGVTSNSPSSLPEFSGPNADVLKKMAQRRLQELGGTPAK
jgi:hypothetical protein